MTYRDQRAVYGAPPPPRERKPCRLCGGPEPLAYVDHFDACCWRCSQLASHLPALGHAIARSVRRAEAAGLVEDVKDCANEAVGAAESYSPVRLRHAIERMDAALDRLARLAGGGA